ncbi:hypothetical protein HII36_32015 [Nonomuraea sp. NN258]|uniref:fascin domain-containing protein n=1 Tax=Nonomuraea antri TaxID=2730852 RepID=UPI001569942C|nr:hypothetical protein [Nonomuraea antri]NRQ36426.1 hypothetical protein [Nonomuraea antri]
MRRTLAILTAVLTLLTGMLSAGPAFADDTPITSMEELLARAQQGSRSPDNASSVEEAAATYCDDVNLRSRVTGKWVSVRLNDNNRLYATGEKRGSWERFRFCYDARGERDSLWSYAASRYVSNRMNNGNLIQAYSPSYNSWEQFDVFPHDNGYWCIYSIENTGFVSTRDNEGDVLRANRYFCNSWEEYQIYYAS